MSLLLIHAAATASGQVSGDAAMPTEIAPASQHESSFLWPHYTNLEALAATANTPFRVVEPTALFGLRSEQATIPLPSFVTRPHTASAGYGLLLVGLVCLYATLIYRHLGDVRLLLARMTLTGSAGERLQEDSGSSFSKFLTICGWLGLGLLSAAVVRVAAPALPIEWVAQMPEWAALTVVVALLGAFLLVLLYQAGVTALVGVLTFSQPLMQQLWLVKRMLFALMTILCAPPLLLLLAGDTPSRFWLWVIIIELIISAILYLHETRTLFLSKKISILHWFLYLCTVEIFPISLLWLLVLRHV